MCLNITNESYQLNFTAYDVKVGIRTNYKNFLSIIESRLPEIFPKLFNLRANDDFSDHLIEIKQEENEKFTIYKNHERVSLGSGFENLIKYCESHIRLTIAEYASKRVFLHAGVIGWKGKAIIFPATSFAGKTTLVAELIKQGAVYFSDEYAVLDSDALVHPFPKMLSLRGIIDNYSQLDFPARSFGAKTATEPLPVGLILITKFDALNEAATLPPTILSPGAGFLETLAHAIPIRRNPVFTLNVLNKLVSRAIIAKTQRGEAKNFAGHLLKYLDSIF